MMPLRLFIASTLLLCAGGLLRAADNLRLNPNLNYEKNGWNGPLIKADNINDGLNPDRVNFIFFYADFCFNAKREAQFTVNLYNKYRDRVHFVILDVLDPVTKEQVKIAKKYWTGGFPHVTILGKDAAVVFDYTGEASEAVLDGWLKVALSSAGNSQAASERPNADGAVSDTATH
jgi:hypothetical protein